MMTHLSEDIRDDIEELGQAAANFNGEYREAWGRVSEWLNRQSSIAIPEPSWNQAPEWARWWAVDGSGATWFEYGPIADKGGNWTVGMDWDDMGERAGAGDIDIPLGIDWRTLRQERPQPATERD